MRGPAGRPVGGNSPHDGLVPARVGGAIVAGLRLVHAVSQPQAHVRVHPGQAIVLGQFCLPSDTVNGAVVNGQWSMVNGRLRE